jgi:hypothetical protein
VRLRTVVIPEVLRGYWLMIHVDVAEDASIELEWFVR